MVLQNERSHQLYVPNQAAMSRGHQRKRQHASSGVVRGLVHRKALLVHLMFEALDYLASEHRMARRGPPHSQLLQLYLGQILKDRNHGPASSQGTGPFICVRLDQSIGANASIAFR